MVIERLLWFSIVKYRLSTLGMSCSCPRVMSPTPGRSTLMHIGAEPGEKLRAGRPRLHVGEVQDANAVECFGHLMLLPSSSGRCED